MLEISLLVSTPLPSAHPGCRRAHRLLAVEACLDIGTRDVGWLSTWSVEHTSHYFYLYHHFAWWNTLHITSIIVFVWWNPPFWFYAIEIIPNPPVSFLEAAMSTTAAPIITTCSGRTSGPAASCATARKKSGLLSGDGYWWFIQWIGLRENLQESPIFNGKIYGFL